MTDEIRINDLPRSAHNIIQRAAEAKQKMDRLKNGPQPNYTWSEASKIQFAAAFAKADGNYEAYVQALLSITGTQNPYPFHRFIREAIDSPLIKLTN